MSKNKCVFIADIEIDAADFLTKKDTEDIMAKTNAFLRNLADEYGVGFYGDLYVGFIDADVSSDDTATFIPGNKTIN